MRPGEEPCVYCVYCADDDSRQDSPDTRVQQTNPAVKARKAAEIVEAHPMPMDWISGRQTVVPAAPIANLII